MEGHERDPLGRLAKLIGVRHQRHHREELLERLVGRGDGDELRDVLDPALGLMGALGGQLGKVAGLLDHQTHEAAGVEIPGLRWGLDGERAGTRIHVHLGFVIVIVIVD